MENETLADQTTTDRQHKRGHNINWTNT